MSDIGQKNADEDRLRVINKSELPLSAKLPVEVEPTSDRVPAQVAVLRSKRASGKSSRSKEKLRASFPVDMPVSPSMSSLETSTKSPSLSLDPKAEEDSHIVKSRKTPKKRKIAEPSVTEDSQADVTIEAEPSVEEDDSIPIQCSPEVEEPQDAKVRPSHNLLLEVE